MRELTEHEQGERARRRAGIDSFLAQRSWFLNEIPDSRYFLRYVVGRFAGAPNPAAMVDPFQVADVYLSRPPGRSLSAIVSQVEDELRRS